ncbi:hypothetical protein N9J72_01035 [Candidatus Gracilibacteria bacterium]|nr:hypothetical protein [Candidatus Gracilibacteria bacterium]
MVEVLQHPFVLAAITFFIVVIGTISVLLSGASETKTIDTSAGQIIQHTSNGVHDILNVSHNAPDE